MDMDKCNPVSTPGLQVTDKDLATEEQLPEVQAGLYRRVTGRLLRVAGQRPDAQQAVKELARGTRSPTNIHWARLKRVMRYLLNKRTGSWKFEPTASESRDTELTVTSDRDWAGCAKTRRSTTRIVLSYAGSTIATMSRTQGSVSLSLAEYYGMVSANVEAKQVQQILGEYHEDTHIILETDSSAAKANAERPGCGRMTHISVQYRYLQDAITNQEVWLRKLGTKHTVADGLTKTVNRQVPRNMLATLKIELLVTTHKQVSINLIAAESVQHELMGEQKSTPGARGVSPSTGHKNIVKYCLENFLRTS